MTAYDLTPKTTTVPAAALKVGDVVLESHEHPAMITKITFSTRNGVTIRCRFVWQRTTEPDWLLGSFPNDARILKAVR